MFVLYKVFTVSIYLSIYVISIGHEVNQILLPNVQRRILCQQAKGDLSHAVSKLFQKILDNSLTKPYSWSKHGEFQEIFQKEKHENSRKSCIQKKLHPCKNKRLELEPPKLDKVGRCFSFSKGHQFLFCLRTRLTGDQDRSYNETETSFGPFSSAERTTVWTMSIQTDDYWTTHFSLISKVDTCDMKWLHDWRCSKKMMPGNGKVI